MMPGLQVTLWNYLYFLSMNELINSNSSTATGRPSKDNSIKRNILQKFHSFSNIFIFGVNP